MRVEPHHLGPPTFSAAMWPWLLASRVLIKRFPLLFLCRDFASVVSCLMWFAVCYIFLSFLLGMCKHLHNPLTFAPTPSPLRQPHRPGCAAVDRYLTVLCVNLLSCASLALYFGGLLSAGGETECELVFLIMKGVIEVRGRVLHAPWH